MMRALVLAVLAVAAWPAGAAELAIHVTGLRSGAGDVRYGVYAEPRHFPKPEGRIAKGSVAAREDGVTILVRGLAPGSYAVAVYHDKNGNGKFDQWFLGIPLEDFGFSNDARVFFRAPSFSDAVFQVGADDVRITIRLNDSSTADQPAE